MRLRALSLYDSHVHWLGTGQIQTGLQLFQLQNELDITSIETRSEYFRQEWLVGFGWDQTQWPEQKLPSKATLDKVFPSFPVFFQRVDGHCSWVNSLGLKKLGFQEDHPGLLYEQEHFNAYSKLPPYSDQQIRSSLQVGCRIFNQAGFTHIRDMTCTEQQWAQARDLDLAGGLSLYVEENFLCENPKELNKVLALATKARREETSHLKVQGIKIFFDGTLGSDTAYLSKCSCGQQKRPWGTEDIELLIRRSWAEGLEVAVHTIGDEAAHQVVLIARKLMATNEVTGWLNLEHVEVLRPETIQIMKSLHVRCHMQPSHWLSDRVWLKEKLGDLYQYVFPWGALSRSRVPLYFGSDSPVAKSSFKDNQTALIESSKSGIEKIKGQILDFHCHPNPAPETYSIFDDLCLKELFFDGQKII